MKAAIGFIALAVIAGLLIGMTRLGTSDVIVANYAAADAAIVAELLGDKIDAAATARLCRTEVRGYAGTIRLLVLPAKAINPNTASEKIAAVRVLSHNETPGIGDFIEVGKSDWIRSFEERSRSSLETEIDAVSGATITRRAMIKGVALACLN